MEIHAILNSDFEVFIKNYEFNIKNSKTKTFDWIDSIHWLLFTKNFAIVVLQSELESQFNYTTNINHFSFFFFSKFHHARKVLPPRYVRDE